MYVCICNAFTCRDVRRVKSQGVSKSRQVYKKLGCRMQCGKCLETIDNVLKEYHDLFRFSQVCSRRPSKASSF